MGKPRKTRGQLDQLYNAFVQGLKDGKPQREVEMALGITDKYSSRFIARAVEEGIVGDLFGKATFQIFTGTTTLSEIADQMRVAVHSEKSKEQIWKVTKEGEGLIIEPHLIEKLMWWQSSEDGVLNDNTPPQSDEDEGADIDGGEPRLSGLVPSNKNESEQQL